MSDQDEMSPGLLRQRRNYIIVSCILIFLVFSQVKIETLSLLGLKFSDFKKPEAIYVALWISYIYFTIRYIQYFTKEGLILVRNAYIGTFSNLVNYYAFQETHKIKPNSFYEPTNYKAMSKNKWVINISDPYEEFFEKVQLNRFKVFRLFIYSILDVTFKQSIFWDYVIPFIIGAIAFFYCFSGSEPTLLNAVKMLFA